MIDKKVNGNHGNGSKWIRRERRLAIYLRDGLACVYCGASLEDGAVLSLDHIVPTSKNGGDNNENLITACVKCNRSRGNRDIATFVYAVAQYLNHDITSEQIITQIVVNAARPIDYRAAKNLIALRGSWQAALAAVSGEVASGEAVGDEAVSDRVAGGVETVLTEIRGDLVTELTEYRPSRKESEEKEEK